MTNRPFCSGPSHGTTHGDLALFLKERGKSGHLTDPDDMENTDKVFFRRFHPSIEGSIHKDWKGKTLRFGPRANATFLQFWLTPAHGPRWFLGC